MKKAQLQIEYTKLKTRAKKVNEFLKEHISDAEFMIEANQKYIKYDIKNNFFTKQSLEFYKKQLHKYKQIQKILKGEK